MACWVVGMLLLVGGLVVIVLVILVVVFLSVRSMRAEEGADRPARSAGRDRAGRGDLRRGAAGREPARRMAAEDDWLADHEPDFGEAEHDQARGMLPHPRGHQHDEDPGRRTGPQKRADARRRQRQQTGSRVTGSGRDQSAADWSAGDWGGVSDEQYWAELSADKPLATTARSAPAGAAYPEAVTGAAAADADPADPGGRRTGRDPAPSMAAAGASTAQFSLPSASAWQGRLPAGPADSPVPAEPPAFAGRAADAQPATSAEPWADPMSTGSVDTDPGIGMRGWQDDGWRNAPGDAAAWQAPDEDEPAVQDSRAWTEDPLTSPSFSQPRSYSTDGRSYHGSHTRDRSHLAQPGGGSYTSPYGHGQDPQTAPAWEGSYGSSHDDGWRDSGHEYPGGRLDPLPESAGPAAGPDGGWYSAPTSPGGSAFYRQPSHESWERRETGYDDASRHDPYTEPGRRSWPDQHESARYETSGYDADQGRDLASSGYYGDTGYDAADSGYGQPDHRHGGTGYDEPGYSRGEAGYRPAEHGPADTGYDLPDYGRGYQRSGHDAPDADYGLPGHGSGASRGSFDQGSGYPRYPGYDAGRR
jgi:hypothetical protein